MNPPLRWLLLGGALIASLVASFVGGPPEGDAPPAPAARSVVPRTSSAMAVASPGVRPVLGPVAMNPFRAPPAPRPVRAASAPVVPTAAVAPPLPFVYLGQAQDGGTHTVFLGQGPRTFLLQVGDVVADYRVLAIGATEVALMYGPLNQRQVLSTGRLP